VNFLSQVFGFFKSFQCWVTVAPWEMGLRVRLGKTALVLAPGPHLRIPFLDRIFIQPVRLRAIGDTGQTIMLKDGKAITVQVSIMYRIVDILKLHMTVANPETMLLAMVQSRIASVLNQSYATGITPEKIESIGKLPGEEWGLADVQIRVRTVAIARVFRLMNCDYSMTSNTNNLQSTTDPA
jgi:regulator of protease activity HflC (stomatin/prohibitin superfamily)